MITRTCIVLALLVAPALAQEDPPELDWLEGSITVGRDLATVDLPDGWSGLIGRDARYWVEDVWENPADPSVMGIVFPPGETEDMVGDWGMIISWEKEGYVDDSDARDIDFDDLLDSMQEDEEEENAALSQAGYRTVTTLGYATAPHYDSAGKKLHWALKLQFEGVEEVTLNYNVRILGRRGVLIMNAVADLSQLDDVAAGSKEILSRTEFTAGNRYSDFDSSIDKVAVYGIGGLIAGKALLKTGLLLKFGKFILIGIVGLFAVLRKFLPGGRKQGRSRRSQPVEEEDFEDVEEDDED